MCVYCCSSGSYAALDPKVLPSLTDKFERHDLNVFKLGSQVIPRGSHGGQGGSRPVRMSGSRARACLHAHLRSCTRRLLFRRRACERAFQQRAPRVGL
jgi:hypothetical protein